LQFTEIFFSYPYLIVNAAASEKTTIKLFDALGRMQMESISLQLHEGRNEIALPSSLSKEGVYIVQLVVASKVLSKKINL